jgi:hypothetical protein
MNPLPSLNLAIARLLNTGPDNFAIWVVKAPYPSGYVLHDCLWPVELTQVWQEWQQMFAGHDPLNISPSSTPVPPKQLPLNLVSPSSGQTAYSSRLMQYLGISLWHWLFDGQILGSLERSRGIAMGQRTRLRFRLEIRDPHLIALPWEIMQRDGQSAMSLSQDLLFSRTTSEVEPLPYSRTSQALNILLVLGEDETKNLQLQEEAAILTQALAQGSPFGSNSQGYAPCMVNKLLQPTPQELLQELETKAYNVFFYAGHGEPNPDGGLLFLRPGMTLNGIELAQALTRTGVKLAVFTACWGAYPATTNDHQAIPHSSLAEVLIRHGVPAVLGMRDQISDRESHRFIQTFAKALRSRKPIDEAVAEARQELLTIYKFNQPAWTLPVLYLHPDFNGELIKSFDEGNTELPDTAIPSMTGEVPTGYLRSLSPGGQAWPLRSAGVTRIGRTRDNDIVIPEPSVSRRHAEILCRHTFIGSSPMRTYSLQDVSTHGTTWLLSPNGWQQILREEVVLQPGMQLKFGSSTRGDIWEFMIDES